MTVNTFITIQKTSISNNYFSFELLINQIILFFFSVSTKILSSPTDLNYDNDDKC